MDVEDVNMEQFHVISLLGADARIPSRTSDLEKAREDLNKKTIKLHLRHALSWLLRGALVLSLLLSGLYLVEGNIGGAMSWTAGFLGVYIFWFSAAGHLKIQSDRQAKLYWLETDAERSGFRRKDTMVATMPVQESFEQARCYSNAAS